MSFIENYKYKAIEMLIIKKKDGEKEGNEKLFYFSVNILLPFKEKYEISSYTTKDDDIKLSSWYQASYIYHRKKEVH